MANLKAKVKIDVSAELLEKLAEVGDFEIFHQTGNNITTVRFIDWMEEDEKFIGNDFVAVLKTASNLGHSDAWLDKKIPMPEWITEELKCQNEVE